MLFCDFAVVLILDELIFLVVGFIEILGPSAWTLATHLEARYLATSLTVFTLRGNLPRSGIYHQRETQRSSFTAHSPRVLESASSAFSKIDCTKFICDSVGSGLAKLFILTQYSSNNLTMMQLSAVNKIVAHRQRKTTFLNKPSSSASTIQASTAANCNRARSHLDPPPDTNTSTYTH